MSKDDKQYNGTGMDGYSGKKKVIGEGYTGRVNGYQPEAKKGFQPTQGHQPPSNTGGNPSNPPGED
ncbi:hypothetical protein [Vibrio furnissii]|uniref:hypothetical protein n=1 Tax=Vibrio furnissii TaxID=29494 RepID=UPI00257399D2|nr:hypothetical protein [Vibrio furnissii]WJG23024.1 hypothetical protein QSU95_07645 [Vibrio furnissii]WJG23030.1 hypothetical protein QSU95_07680 [Vibrio furnissii]WJG23036.1 hypothetical protein QSU95_07715 [Vibrio furnissii]